MNVYERADYLMRFHSINDVANIVSNNDYDIYSVVFEYLTNSYNEY